MLTRSLIATALLTLVFPAVASAQVDVTNTGHALEDASILFHDYLHDTYDDTGLYDDAVGASHDMEDTATALHDLLHDLDDGLADAADVPAAFDAVEDAFKSLNVAFKSSGLNGSDPTARDMFKTIQNEYKQLRKDLKKDGLI